MWRSICLKGEPLTESFIWGIIGLLFLEMPRSTSEVVIIVSGWDDQCKVDEIPLQPR
jgi:hypothetical protein